MESFSRINLIAMIEKRQAVVSFFALLTIAIIGEVANAGPPRKILGGEDASLGEFPYLVSLRQEDVHVCGGAIIGSKYILTASHCVYHMESPYSNVTVVTGTLSPFQGGNTYSVSKVIVHRGFDITIPISSNDIALIKLNSDITFDNHTSIINLPKAVTSANVPAVIAGWGSTKENANVIPSVLQKASMLTVDPATCETLLEHYITIYSSQICAFKARGIGTCHGDSGGPLVAGNELIGVASFTVPCAQGYPEVYTAVYSYLDWITKNMK